MIPRARLQYALVASLLCVFPAAHGAGYILTGQTLDVAGGASSSAGYALVSCLGYEPGAGAGGGAYRIANGCGAALGIMSGLPNLPAVTGGGTQTTGVNHPFPSPLQVTVVDAYGIPVGGVTVTFTPPGSGASAALSGGGVAMTDAAGVASVTATANGSTGGYVVAAVVGGLPAVDFNLTNDTTPVSLQTFAAD